MPVPISISELSTTPGSNSPSGSDAPSVLDDHQRTAYAFIKTLSDEKAAIADAVLLTGAQTVAGVKTFSSPIVGTIAGAVRVDVASASTVNLTTGAVGTDSVNITGTTTITSFTVVAGRLLFVRFNAALTLTNNASIVTQAGASIVTQAGDTCILRATAANVVEVLAYARSSSSGPIRSYQGNLSGASVRELTGIPSWARKIVVEYWAASTNAANSVPGIEIGPSGYGGSGAVITSQTLNANQTVVAAVAVATPLLSTSWAADIVVYGKAEFEFVGSTGSAERWLCTLTGLRADLSATISSTAHITFSTGIVVDRVRMTTRSADQWDAGEWAVAIYP